MKLKLKHKFLAIALGIVLFLGLSMLFFIKTTLTQKLIIEIQEKGIFMAKHLASMGTDHVLTAQIINLNIIINDYKHEDNDVAYAFIQDSQGRVLAHTFNRGFPIELKGINIVSAGQEYSIRSFVSDGIKIYDIAAPLSREAGTAHVGISEAFTRSSVDDIVSFILKIIIGVLILGGSLALIFTAKITQPLSRLIDVANAVGSGNFAKKVDIRTGDEIGQLGNTFNKMTRKLRETTVSRDNLTKEVIERRRVEKEIEERNREIDENRQKLKLALAEISALIENVIRKKDFSVRFSNPTIKKCYEIKNCKKEECPCYGKEAMRCWKVAGTYCGGKVQGVFAQKFGNCSLCDVYKKSTLDPIYDIGEHFNNMMHILELKNRELEEAYEELQAVTVKLASSNKELQDFAYVASHDLQEPLRKITTFGDRLKGKYASLLGEQGKDYLERMQDSARRMQALIDGLLDYSRVTTKSSPFTPTDLSTITREVLLDLEVRIEKTGAKVELSDLPTIEADPVQMRQLLQNLIGNALKFNKKDEPPVVKVHGKFSNGTDASSGDDYYQLTVEDNGIGFDEQYAERIFGVFQRLHGKDEYDGSGIGLSVCRKIVERHGGTIEAKSTSGEGAQFTITLPTKRMKEEPALG